MFELIHVIIHAFKLNALKAGIRKINALNTFKLGAGGRVSDKFVKVELVSGVKGLKGWLGLQVINFCPCAPRSSSLVSLINRGPSRSKDGSNLEQSLVRMPLLLRPFILIIFS